VGLLNANYDNSEAFYHHYTMRHADDANKKLDGIEIILVELQKFKVQTPVEKRLQALWIRFLNEAEGMYEIPDDFKEYTEFNDAFELVQESAYNRSELETYNKYWDSVSTDITLMDGKFKEGVEKGIEIGVAEGIAKGKLEGVAEGERLAKIAMGHNLKQMGLSTDQIMIVSGLSRDVIEQL
jgi:predicted transposase/invertase (TIGR01784 family)